MLARLAPETRRDAPQDLGAAAADPQPRRGRRERRHARPHRARAPRRRRGHRLSREGAGDRGPRAQGPRAQAGGVARSDEAAVARRGGDFRRRVHQAHERAHGLHAVPDSAPAARDGRAERRAPRGAPRGSPTASSSAPRSRGADIGRPGPRLPRGARARRAGTPGTSVASRSLIVGADKEAARAAARELPRAHVRMYRDWEMQESTMVPLQLGFDTALDDWTINGSPRGLRGDDRAAPASSGSTASASPSTACRARCEARIDYLQMIAERDPGAGGRAGVTAARRPDAVLRPLRAPPAGDRRRGQRPAPRARRGRRCPTPAAPSCCS